MRGGAGALQDTVDTLLPLVDRAEKNAGVVLAQQKTLTAGRPGAARASTASRPTCCDVAETVAALKLQSGASAAELSARRASW